MVTIMMILMMIVLILMNCDSCCLTVPLTTLLTGAQVKNNYKRKKKKNHEINLPEQHDPAVCVLAQCHMSLFHLSLLYAPKPLPLFKTNKKTFMVLSDSRLVFLISFNLQVLNASFAMKTRLMSSLVAVCPMTAFGLFIPSLRI